MTLEAYSALESKDKCLVDLLIVLAKKVDLTNELLKEILAS